jgi:dTDP-4-dehydrorhamnose reductase
MKSLLVIGGLGLLGNRIVEKAKGKFSVSYTYHNGDTWHPAEIAGHKLDVTDLPASRKLINETKPDAVINTTAFHVVDACEKDPAKAKLVNTDAVLNLATACEKIGAHYTFMSTDYVFDGT